MVYYHDWTPHSTETTLHTPQSSTVFFQGPTSKIQGNQSSVIIIELHVDMGAIRSSWERRAMAMAPQQVQQQALAPQSKLGRKECMTKSYDDLAIPAYTGIQL